MAFDKRNPFADWGFSADVKYDSIVDNSNENLVDGGAHPATAGQFKTEQKDVFFTNNENMCETLYSAKRMVKGSDIIRNSDEKHIVNGIHADDWKLYGEETEESNEETQNGSTEPNGDDDDEQSNTPEANGDDDDEQEM